MIHRHIAAQKIVMGLQYQAVAQAAPQLAALREVAREAQELTETRAHHHRME